MKRYRGEDFLTFSDVKSLEEKLSEPTPATVESVAKVSGDIMLLGAGGKMGLSLARMARRATLAAGMVRSVIAVSRFTNPTMQEKFAEAQIETLSGDLLDQQFLATLPDCENIIYMVGQKFGTSSDASATWATNAYLPGIVCQQFAHSRIVAFSTGNVYPLVPIESGGSQESHQLLPVGEYGMSALARERIFEYFSRTMNLPIAILRLNYATELRYGVLVDLAQKVFREEPISLAMGYFNCVWQGDANNMTLRSLSHTESPPRVFNMTGSEILRCRDVCERLAMLMNRQVTFLDTEAPIALLNDARSAYEFLGAPTVSIDELLESTADWITSGGETLHKPTHFQVRDGKF